MNKYPYVQAIPEVVNTKEKAFIKSQKKQLLISTALCLPLYLLDTNVPVMLYIWIASIVFILFIEPVISGIKPTKSPVEGYAKVKYSRDEASSWNNDLINNPMYSHLPININYHRNN